MLQVFFRQLIIIMIKLRGINCKSKLNNCKESMTTDEWYPVLL